MLVDIHEIWSWLNFLHFQTSASTDAEEFTKICQLFARQLQSINRSTYLALYVSAFVFWWLCKFSNIVTEWNQSEVVKRFLWGVFVHRPYLVLLSAVFGETRRQSASAWLNGETAKWIFVRRPPKMGVWWWCQQPCLWKHHYLHVTPQSLPIVWQLPHLPLTPALISRTCPPSLYKRRTEP